ncbi:multidrug effflux MFS transporter [Streptomyces aidingensis]|uniref:MFS transporter, DHA1 family, bicyclomycin/chloramphenicol resistance protein n=1 Tax=Streptomyces aidingensis TaxID=910347 RepID=A0A1I1L4N1_9ACTN|nr:multidrug effflux MFS transporter [Streptomyces aidingensis]SFC68037.1 MFS transporter, DHA1 family, bicyclomycin/chloramphenicol resistance protein [Streptomyces aidingensis]
MSQPGQPATAVAEPRPVQTRIPFRLPARGRRGRRPSPGQLGPRGRSGLLLVLILGSLTAIPPLALDLYLPALPGVGDALGTSAATVQVTLAACLGGLGLGQLITGPMSDQLGRRRPLIAGMTVFALASVACALAPTIETLIAFRALQGLAGAAGVVISRAVVRDMFDGLAMARFFSTLLLISGVAPVLAPVFGGQMLRITSWRGLFVVLAGIGVLLVLAVVRWLPETLPAEQRHGGGIRTTLRDMRGLLRDRVFTGYLLTCTATFAALFAYVAASPFVVQEIYGGSPQTFSLLFMVNSIGLVTVGQINGKILVGRVSLDRVTALGLATLLLAATALLLMTSGVFGRVGLLPVAAGLFVLMSAMTLVLPNANSQALMRTPHAAGSASALLGAAQFGLGGLVSPLVGIAGEDTAVPMAVLQLTAVLLAIAAFLALCRPWSPRPAIPGNGHTIAAARPD